jgi:hypothetical protein
MARLAQSRCVSEIDGWADLNGADRPRRHHSAQSLCRSIRSRINNLFVFVFQLETNVRIVPSQNGMGLLMPQLTSHRVRHSSNRTHRITPH